MMNQSELISNFINNDRERFNPNLLEYNDYDTINAVLDGIASCQRDNLFTFKMLSHYTIEDPEYINEYLKKYDDYNRSKSSKKNKENKYEYISLKDTDIILLVVKYYLEVKGAKKIIEMPIAIPKIMEKYYFKLNGIWYYPMQQIVDGSTYNHTTKKKKDRGTVSLKLFMPLRINRQIVKIKTVNGISLESTIYKLNIFKKSFYANIFTLAKYGLLNGIKYLGYADAVIFTQELPEDDTLYIFKKRDFYICVPKILFDNDNALQSLVVSLLKSINRLKYYNEIFIHDFWLKSISHEINGKYSPEKGMQFCESLEGTYGVATRKMLRLDMEDKIDIYALIRWITREFSNLMTKNNLDINNKRLRKVEYIASIYTEKLYRSIIRITGRKKDLDLSALETAIKIKPMHIIRGLTKLQVISYRNCVNDFDILNTLKYTFKGPNGIGNNTDRISKEYRQVHISHMGKLDINSSGNTDPGLTGRIAPYADIKDDMYFDSDYKEPNTWRAEFSKLMKIYNDERGFKEIIQFKKSADADFDLDYHNKMKEELSYENNKMKPVLDIINMDDTIYRDPFTILGGDIMVRKYVYFQFSKEQLDNSIKTELKLGKKYIPGKVIIKGKPYMFTEITSTTNSKYKDARIIAQGYSDEMNYNEPYCD